MLIGTQGKTWAITKHTQTHTHMVHCHCHCNNTFERRKEERRLISTIDLRPQFRDLCFRKVNVKLRNKTN